jgi:hypothetical protein
MLVRFPNGDREFRLTEKMLEEGDVIWHAGARYKVISVSGDEQPTVTVEADSDALGDVLRSEEGAITLTPLE